MVEILEILEKYGVKIAKDGNRHKALCPIHNEKTPSFVVYPESNSWYCFGHGDGGSPEYLVSKLEGISLNKAKEKLYGKPDELSALTEVLDGMLVQEEPINLNEQLNIEIGRLVRNVLMRDGSKDFVIFPLLKEWDAQRFIRNDQKVKSLKQITSKEYEEWLRRFSNV
jgi:DNA primase